MEIIQEDPEAVHPNPSLLLRTDMDKNDLLSGPVDCQRFYGLFLKTHQSSATGIRFHVH